MTTAGTSEGWYHKQLPLNTMTPVLVEATVAPEVDSALQPFVITPTPLASFAYASWR